MNATVSAMEARKRFGEILNSALYRGISTVIKRKGKSIAKIVPILDDRAVSRKDILAYAGIWKDANDVSRMKKETVRLRRSAVRTMKPL
ncbi:type II toxin-antitoxin system Phd/YefM family antitoxin [Candidatus Gottesmanbacteria bacterium]|nr:type II toxin-antitoxin system Phd/YefM family antitoxin [Candidatus Gottesmanbacteria bacterium]